MITDSSFLLSTSEDTLAFHRTSGRLVSLRHKAVSDLELLAEPESQPTLVLQYLDETRAFREISSDTAESVSVNIGEGGELVRIEFHNLGGLAIDAVVEVRAIASERFSRWRLILHNNSGTLVTHVQFPFIVLRYGLGVEQGADELVWPLDRGLVRRAPKPGDLSSDAPETWQMIPKNGDSFHYPGLTFAQFLAYTGEKAGVYLACEDTSGSVKMIRPVHRTQGIRLGMAHVGDWPTEGSRTLEYDVVLTTLEGDWYAAAELYRDWTLRQPWAAKSLSTRTDVPEWLLDSPPHIILRIQGELDDGPAPPNAEFLPYPRSLPLLDALAERIEAPIVPVIMSWERPGPWIYPDCFPPAGGYDSLREFTAAARQRGWRIGTFCNGTRWVTGHAWTGYDGREWFEEQGGEASVCRTQAQEMWPENWDATWRPSFPCCVGAEQTRDIADKFVRTLVDLGLDWIQFFDQNVGCCSFPCFSPDHGHDSVPGRWMTAMMHSLIERLRCNMQPTSDGARGERTFVLSVEAVVNEHFLQDVQLCDIRIYPPGYGSHFVPLYHFIYHEFLVIQGGFGAAPEPYHLQIRNAYNLVVGEIPGAVMTGDGLLLNRDTMNWAPWRPPVGDNDASVEVLRTTTALRRGPARDFLVFGRMLRPGVVNGPTNIRWTYSDRENDVPPIFHAAWQAPDGRAAVVLANWTAEEQTACVSHDRFGARVQVHLSARAMYSEERALSGGHIEIVLPPLSCALLEEVRSKN